MNWPDDFINKIICGDCMDILPLIPDGAVDAVITDPPYGKKWARGKHGIGEIKGANEKLENVQWDNKPPSTAFEEIFRVSQNQVVCGGNYFTDNLPPSNCWLVWDKLGNLKLGEQIPFADCELIWTSFNTVVKKFTLRQQGFINDGKMERCHPTQKPIELMSWIINKHTKPDDLILDPYAGSGTTLVAAKQLGRRYIGIEISEDYCRIAEDRLRQGELFNKEMVG